ncbi:MAG TPA: hypothetical protein VFB75_03490 [Burkholderiales bacterium]|nr:hypothetical protein [Burkholderiales bacterium]
MKTHLQSAALEVACMLVRMQQNRGSFAGRRLLCYRALVRKLLLLLIFCFLAPALPASAQFIQQRILPANAVRGTLGEPQVFPTVRIGSRTLRLSPGARIYDRSNRTIVHGQLPSGAEVLYSTDQAGDIQRMYILTEEELLRLRQAGKR